MVRDLADRLRRLPNGIVWLLGAIPLALLVWDIFTGGLGIDPVRDIEHRLGRTALYFVIGSLCFTPALRLFRINLVKFRRPVGLVAFSYAALHFATWIVLDMGFLWSQIVADIVKRPYLILGMIALTILTVMAVTSGNRVLRKLGPVRWRRIHRMIYAAAPIAVLHWLISHKIWPVWGITMGTAVLLLLALRVPVIQTNLRKLVS
ncbi:sulfite oxidase heme-binding subunit YedZ [Paracoccus marinus]|uniref:sulfite oxidase heme-binding subunit YedZ n=1 Tax=Paracoccus marinus TaxID=288426 RepID=UPI0010408AF5|nr:protein-methionine-sulfoxide reductase heme-binding subunit MsrQ [Paracoccus marinus]GLS81927.1 protein-methionine-sulfoxide reductase heme-binding subunit MsrQ [Paracoccus marinus]